MRNNLLHGRSCIEKKEYPNSADLPMRQLNDVRASGSESEDDFDLYPRNDSKCDFSGDENRCSSSLDDLHSELDLDIASCCCCSIRCRTLVQCYAIKLGDPLKRLRSNALQHISHGLSSALLQPTHQPRSVSSAEVAARGKDGVVTMLAEIKERDCTGLYPAVPSSPQEHSSHAAVEGYTPSRGRDSSALICSEVHKSESDTDKGTYCSAPEPKSILKMSSFPAPQIRNPISKSVSFDSQVGLSVYVRAGMF